MSPIDLSMEIPVSMLETLSPYTELDFALAHQVLQDPVYRDHYFARRPGRELILDNSVHELGAPLSIPELLHASEAVHADYLISPDKLEDSDWTIDQYNALYAAGRRVKLAAVLTGNTLEDRVKHLSRILGAPMLCLPYRRPRIEWFFEQLETITRTWNRIHLLGVSSIAELRAWIWIADRFPNIRFSVDTSKPIKWGLLGRSLDTNESIRHAPVSSTQLLGARSVESQRIAIHENILFLRSILNP